VQGQILNTKKCDKNPALVPIFSHHESHMIKQRCTRGSPVESQLLTPCLLLGHLVLVVLILMDCTCVCRICGYLNYTTDPEQVKTASLVLPSKGGLLVSGCSCESQATKCIHVLVADDTQITVFCVRIACKIRGAFGNDLDSPHLQKVYYL
jgi:hypothetical protein